MAADMNDTGGAAPWLAHTRTAIAVCMSAYHLWTGFFGTPAGEIHFPLHLLFALAVLFLAGGSGGPVFGAEYVKALQGARINLGLLSKGNRDDHTQRSLEVPALGSLLCAERTPDHLEMYAEGQEAVFWSDAAECARLCHALLADEPRRAAIAAAGQRRVHANGDFNQPMLARVLATLASA